MSGFGNNGVDDLRKESIFDLEAHEWYEGWKKMYEKVLDICKKLENYKPLAQDSQG